MPDRSQAGAQGPEEQWRVQGRNRPTCKLGRIWPLRGRHAELGKCVNRALEKLLHPGLCGWLDVSWPWLGLSFILCERTLLAKLIWKVPSSLESQWFSYLSVCFVCVFYFWPCGIEAVPPAVEAWSPDHWTTPRKSQQSMAFNSRSWNSRVFCSYILCDCKRLRVYLFKVFQTLQF